MTPPSSPSPSERLLATAALLFAAEGIRAVGIDRLISEAGVARASLYQAFGSKDQLITEYLRRQHDIDRRAWQAAARDAGANPVDQVLALFDCAAKAAKRRRYAGCLYLNAAAEFPDRTHPVHGAVGEHRRWVREEVGRLLAAAGLAGASDIAKSVQLLYDGGLTGSKLDRSVAPIHRAESMARTLIDAATRPDPAT
ncbi:TetR/AcrR family transcriptional regulator [Nocardia sp. BMG51109]|uniref:TetR/AcrR family transcriptional regulator n=1 Tax=Nocardia sp. BMG51109 TaxID=1056816 RepID=UPI0006867C0A|nr:TetR/AcrR family transcriptional regulator [Nocardia sp. BMG51109]